MAIDANEFLARLPADERAAIEARAQELIAEEVGLAELRKLLGRTQAELAGRMDVGQAHVSKIERRGDILLSTLREYVEAAGGSLEIVVRVPDRPALRLHFGSKGRPPGSGPTYAHGRIVQQPGDIASALKGRSPRGAAAGEGRIVLKPGGGGPVIKAPRPGKGGVKGALGHHGKRGVKGGLGHPKAATRKGSGGSPAGGREDG